MRGAIALAQDVSAVGFVLLGLATAAGWLRHRDRSSGFLALAIVLVASLSVLGSASSLLHIDSAFLVSLMLAGFMGAAYSLLRYRGSILPLPGRWHVVVIVVMVAATGLYIALQAIGAGSRAMSGATFLLLLVWSATVVEPTVRFWLVSQRVPAVQAWRLRSLSMGFGGIVAILFFAVAAGSQLDNSTVELVVQLLVIAIIPLLYVSFAPPAWLRREWRAVEEQGLREFMEELLVEDARADQADRALEWATRLVGGDSAILFDRAGRPSARHSVAPDRAAELHEVLASLTPGANRVMLGGTPASLLVLPVEGLQGTWTLIVTAGPLTPAFGGDEVNRARQFMSAFVTALDRRHLIDELEEMNVQLKDASRHKSVFLANMSHELRTPLNAIIGFSELMADAPAGQYDEVTRKRFLEQILSSGRHLLGLINDILDLSKVEAGQMELHAQPVQVSEAVDQVLRTVEPLMARKSLRVSTNVAAAGEVSADPGKLRQMLLNLVSNAIKFTPEGGNVSISADRTRESVDIAVADTGIGIAEEDQKRIFQEFHQIDHGPDRRHDGTGLGLALTKKFALLHGGDVRVQSRPDKGSVFTLSLPLHRSETEPAEHPAPPAVEEQPGTGPLVLIAEDDAAAAELLTRQLTSTGYRTHVVRTGPDALAAARELRPAAITLDIILPELDGWEVITRLKSDPVTSAIPIVVVSVVDNPELGIALGAIDYFVKPVDARELVHRLSTFHIRHSLGTEEVKVLVVDDEPANRSWLTKALEPAGFTVVPAAGGREAIELARSQRPDLVVLDLMMPGVTGFDVVEAMRSDKSTSETPIMVLTASHLSDAERRQLNGRVSEILSRTALGASDIVGVLQRVVAQRNGSR